MATYLIQVKDGTSTVGVIDPISFRNAVYYSNSGQYLIAINSVAQTFSGSHTATAASSAAGGSLTSSGSIQEVGNQYALTTNSVGDISATTTVTIPFNCEYFLQFTSAANAQSALAQIYTDLNTYYNQ